MKKSLFATTAIVAAFGMGASAANAQDASFTVGGFSEFYASWADQDQPAGGFHQSDYDFQTNTEVEFNGEVTLDNGITAGMMVQLEGDNGATTDIDENIVFLEGSFGRVELGHEDGASDTMSYGATSVKAVAVGTFNNTTGTLVNLTGNAPILTGFGDSGDATKINYYTPRFAGIQFGVTHAPDDDADDPAVMTRGNAIGVAGGDAGTTTDHWEAGVNYVNSFNGFDIAADVTGTYFNSTTAGDAGGDNYNISPGFVVGFGGFEFGASMGIGESRGEDVLAYDAGVGYSTGPWSFSVTGFYAETEDTVRPASTDEDERYEINGGINYALGSGVSVFSSVAFGETDAGDAPGQTGTDPRENEYVSVLTGVGVSF